MIRLLKSEKGQTAVEYILLIFVVVSLGILFFNKMNDYIIKNPKGLIGGPLSKFTNALNQDPKGRFSKYTLPTVLPRKSNE